MDNSDSDDEELLAVVIDNGSNKLKAGFAGDDAHRVVIPSVIGHSELHDGRNDFYVGDDAHCRKEKLWLTYPIQHGIITNWDAMEKIWSHVFEKELRISSEDYHAMLTEPPLNPKTNREKTTEMMFELFSVPGMYLVNEACATLYASGRNCGLVVDIGYSHGHVVPLYEGYHLPHATLPWQIAGQHLDSYLSTIMRERGYILTTDSEMEVVRSLKERFCYTSLDYQGEMQHLSKDPSLERTYTLPDGEVVTIGAERFRCPEALFQPSLCGMRPGGIHETIQKSIVLCDIDIQKEVYNNIVLSGGSTMISGFPQRVENEVRQLSPGHMDVRVIAPPERKSSVWIGASIIASLSTFKHMFITNQEYEEVGPSIVHRKCY